MRLCIIVLFLIFALKTYAPSLEEDHLIKANDYRKVMVEIQKEIKIQKILKTIRTIESSGRYNIPGPGTDYGAYQFIPSTWENYCNKYFGKVLDITNPENQDKVAYLKVKELLGKEFTVAQIAAFWNSGLTTGWENKRGINKDGVPYDVPKHVKRFLNTYATI